MAAWETNVPLHRHQHNIFFQTYTEKTGLAWQFRHAKLIQRAKTGTQIRSKNVVWRHKMA